eukprot:TRINITY_DN1366_c0_g1_i5.p1 TRINITY_DN1366_c0_g1~~TRINITY_DN1366_c0_g1_i5.p1  ORF type:complete len:1439 (+),score=325.11 TRINITY_DN1366_c0_g1_i5:273-4589(+)
MGNLLTVSDTKTRFERNLSPRRGISFDHSVEQIPVFDGSRLESYSNVCSFVVNSRSSLEIFFNERGQKGPSEMKNGSPGLAMVIDIASLSLNDLYVDGAGGIDDLGSLRESFELQESFLNFLMHFGQNGAYDERQNPMRAFEESRDIRFNPRGPHSDASDSREKKISGFILYLTRLFKTVSGNGIGDDGSVLFPDSSMDSQVRPEPDSRILFLNGKHFSFLPSPYFLIIAEEEIIILYRRPKKSVFDSQVETWYTKSSFEHQELQTKFLVFQLMNHLSDLRKSNLTAGKLGPQHLYVRDKLRWIQFVPSPYTMPSCMHHESMDPSLVVRRWVAHEISNYAYISYLNILAGRARGNHKNHPVFPWVFDFDGEMFRDLSKSKFRINKGDEMLDTTYMAGVTPHHITEPLSEVTYFIYLARRKPIEVLQKFVRSTFVAKEYPKTISRMYTWSPDECIPEFYDSPEVFVSIHKEMEDLGLPDGFSNPSEFVKHHRSLLESDYVSLHLHEWIDLVFGHKLRGEAAVEAKNVLLKTSNRFQQLFETPHPKRVIGKTALIHPKRERIYSSDSAIGGDDSGFGDGLDAWDGDPLLDAFAKEAGRDGMKAEMGTDHYHDRIDHAVEESRSFHKIWSSESDLVADVRDDGASFLEEVFEKCPIQWPSIELNPPLAFAAQKVESVDDKLSLEKFISCECDNMWKGFALLSDIENVASLSYSICMPHNLYASSGKRNRRVLTAPVWVKELIDRFVSRGGCMDSFLFPDSFRTVFLLLDRVVRHPFRNRVRYFEKSMKFLHGLDATSIMLVLPFLVDARDLSCKTIIAGLAEKIRDLDGKERKATLSFLQKEIALMIRSAFAMPSGHTIFEKDFMLTLLTIFGCPLFLRFFLPLIFDNGLYSKSQNVAATCSSALIQLHHKRILTPALIFRYIILPQFHLIPQHPGECVHGVRVISEIAQTYSELSEVLQRYIMKPVLQLLQMAVEEGRFSLAHAMTSVIRLGLFQSKDCLQDTSSVLCELIRNHHAAAPSHERIYLTLLDLLEQALQQIDTSFIEMFLLPYFFMMWEIDQSSFISLRLYGLFKSILKSEKLREQPFKWEILDSNLAGIDPCPTIIASRPLEQPSLSAKSSWMDMLVPETKDFSYIIEEGWHFHGEIRQEFVAHTGPVRCVDGIETRFLTGGKDSRVFIWSITEERPLSMYDGHTDPIWHCKVLPNRHQAVSTDGAVHVWDIETMHRISLIRSPGESYKTFAIGEHGRVLLIGTSSASVRLVDLRIKQGGTCQWELDLPLFAQPTLRCVEVHPNGSSVALGFSSGTVSLMDSRCGTLVSTWRPRGPSSIVSMKFLPEQDGLLTIGSADRSLSMWDVRGARQNLHFQEELSEPAHSLCFVEQGFLFAVGGTTMGVCNVLEPDVGVQTAGIQNLVRPSLCGQTLPHHKLLLIGCDDGSLKACC